MCQHKYIVLFFAVFCRLIGSGCIRRGPITNEIGDESSGQTNLYPFIGKQET